MAVVNLLAAMLPDLTAAKPVPAPAFLAHGTLRTSCFTATITNGDSADSTYVVARIPSHARISKLSKIHSSGIAGVTDADLGVSDAPACLVDGETLAATATVEGASQVAVADTTKRLWELAGLTKDPKAELEVLLTLKAAATADGLVTVDLVYITD